MKKNNLFVLMAFFMLSQLSLFGQNDINWVNIAGMEANEKNITKTGSNGWTNGTAISAQELAAGEDGYIQFTIDGDDGNYKVFGFINPSSKVLHQNMNYAFYTIANNNIINIKEAEDKTFTNKKTGIEYADGDIIRLVRKGTEITYYKIRQGYEEVVYVSNVASTTALKAAAIIYFSGGSFQETKFSKGLSIAEDAPITETADEVPTQEVQEGEWGKVHRMTGDKYAFGSDSLKCPGNFKLYVENGILSKRVKVAVENSDNWADYVFEKDYERNSLPQVAKFIKKNQHLPHVPSASHVVKEGIDLQEMDATLLRQVEEIWLHLIDMNQKMKQLEKENKHLKKQLFLKKTPLSKSVGPTDLIKAIIKN